MGSIHDDRCRAFDIAMGKQIERENQERQYNSAYLNNGGTMTFQQWLDDGRYDPSDWGPLQEDNFVNTINGNG